MIVASEQTNFRPLLRIVGPTATGKSALAFRIAENWVKHHPQYTGVTIISADSRQVYEGMEIGTGADVPAEYVEEEADGEKFFQYLSGPVELYGIGLREPTAPWSAYDFVCFARKVIRAAWQARRLAILVGGTGLYHELLWADPTSPLFSLGTEVQDVSGPDESIRERAAELSVEELQEWVKKEAEAAYMLLNDSDRANPRRLIRVLERQKHLPTSPQARPELPDCPPPTHELVIGLTRSLETLQKKIVHRVEDRWSNGMIAETERLLALYRASFAKVPAFSATGYKEVAAFLDGRLEKAPAQAQWSRREFQYAKRQLTWWKKFGNARWVDVDEPNSIENIDALVKAWTMAFPSSEKSLY